MKTRSLAILAVTYLLLGALLCFDCYNHGKTAGFVEAYRMYNPPRK